MDSSLRYSPSYFLFARPSFWAGFGQVLDLGNTMFVFNESVNGEQADFFATRADWLAVGLDLRHAIAEAKRDMAREAVESAP